MMTRCPRCSATFKLLAEHLRAAHGRVQCGRCYIQFDALENLIDAAAGSPPFTTDGAVSGEPSTPRLMPVPQPAAVPDTTMDEDLSFSPNEPEMGNVPLQEMDQSSVEVEGAVIGDEDVPSEEGEESSQISFDEELPYPLEAAPAKKRTSSIWTFFSMLLLLLLAGQLAWWQYDEVLGRWPQLRPIVEQVCQRLHCTVGVRRDLGAIHIVNRDVSEHPRFQHGLLLKLTFMNQAGFVQPYPVLDLVLFNQAGQAIGERRFQPREYLPAGTVVESGMPPGQSIYAVLELAAPSMDEAASFEFNFL
ncbi:MAG TPA: zinc-ribbon and DUF3426 domain-containing protein [Gammaproteobacteria bacterium]|nr:zinc-ribbon and DUF3426 domain-containing protein [Gammaproteobacteria bacterium]